jgi:hypothetical protein
MSQQHRSEDIDRAVEYSFDVGLHDVPRIEADGQCLPHQQLHRLSHADNGWSQTAQSHAD